MENVQETFFSKNNIGLLNNQVLENLQFSNLTQNERIMIANTLVDQMKKVWSTLDFSKINLSNIKSVQKQFNSISLKYCINEVSMILNRQRNNEKDPATLKFERDFKSNPNNGVTFMERSQSNNKMSKLGPNEQSMKKQYQTHSLTNNFQPGLDNQFKPLIENSEDEPMFNSYQRDTKKNQAASFQERLQEIQTLRNSEVPVPDKTTKELPDFLRSKPTSVRQESSNNNSNNFNNNNFNNSVKPLNSNYNNNNDENEMIFLDSMNNDDNLFNINNIDKPLIIGEIEEDNTPFSERLKKLENERNNIAFPEQKNINFTDDNFKDTFDLLKNMQPTNINKLKLNQEQPRQYNQKQPRQYNQEQPRQYNQEQPRQYNQEQPRQYNQEQPRQYNQEQPRLSQRQYGSDLQQKKDELIRQKEELMKQEEYKRYIKQHNEIENKSSKNISSHKELFDQLKNMNINLQSQIVNLKNIINELKLENTTYQEKELFYQESEEILVKREEEIQKHDEEIRQIELSIQKKEKNVQQRETEIKQMELSLQQRELELEHREQEYLKLYNNYLNLINIKNYQLEIEPDNDENNYRYNINNLSNVVGLKLLNYSLPLKRFNIEENINNHFKYRMNNDLKDIRINTGFYTIDQLILALNSNQRDMVFELDSLTQKIIINSDNEFIIIKTTLSTEVLGLKDSSEKSSNFMASKIWDLRIDNKVYLFLSNINDKPFAVLSPTNSVSDSEIKFEKPITLQFLDIIFRDSKGNIINFYNMKHYLNMQITVVNN
jgi:hypothetical protein